MAGRWYCEIVRDEKKKYTANMVIENGEGNCGRVVGLPEGVTYTELRNAIRKNLGVDILRLKDMVFIPSGRGASAIIDATQPRTDCRVFADEMPFWRPHPIFWGANPYAIAGGGEHDAEQ